MTGVYFDLETGGLAETAPVIQLAAIAIDESTWMDLGTFEAKIQFDPAVCEGEALTLNGYTPEAWRDALSPMMAVGFGRDANV